MKRLLKMKSLLTKAFLHIVLVCFSEGFLKFVEEPSAYWEKFWEQICNPSAGFALEGPLGLETHSGLRDP